VRDTVAILVDSLVDAVIGGDYRHRRDNALTADMRLLISRARMGVSK
jgi:hypothetical protein